MIYRAHPDLLFTLFITLSLTFFLKYLISFQPKLLLLASCFWGVAASTKLTLTLFAPGLLAVFWPGLQNSPSKDLQTFIKWSFLSYVIIGFPQSLAFAGVIEFLWQQKRNVLWGDLEFLKTWCELFYSQLKWPVIISTLLLFITPQSSKNPAMALPWRRAMILLILPTFMLLSRRVTSAYEYYPIPFVATLILAFILGGQSVSEVLSSVSWVAQLRKPFHELNRRHPLYIQLSLLILTPWILPAVASTFSVKLQEEKHCSSEAHTIRTLVHREAQSGGRILVDPYIPYANQYHDKEVFMAWDMSPDLIQPNTTMIALKKNYYCIYLTAEEGGCPGVVDHIKNWDKTRTFYRMFFNKNKTEDRLWQKIHSDQCGWEVWKRVNP